MKFLLSLICLFPLLLTAQKSDKKLDRLYDLVDTKKFAEALKEVNALIKQDSSNGEYYIIRARALVGTKKFQEAFAEYDKAVLRAPHDPLMYGERGHYYYTTQNPDLAIDDYNTGLKYVKNNDSLKYNLINNRGVAKQMKRDFSAAYDDFITVLNYDSTHLSALSNIAIVLTEKGKPEEAREYLKKEIRIHPEFIGGYANLGFLNEKIGKYEEAIELYNKVLQMDAKEPRAYNNRGYCKMKQNDLAGALKDINYSLQLYPTNSYAYKNRALVYLEQKDVKKACTDLNKAAELGFSEMYGSEVYLLIQQYCE